MPNPKAEKGEWKNHTLAEIALTDKIFWRAQTTEAPDGKQFTGVRKYIKKANGDEVATKAGITFEIDDDLKKSVNIVVELLQKSAAIMAHVDAKAKKKHPKAEDAKIVSKLTVTFGLQSTTGKYVREGCERGAIKVTLDVEKASLFETSNDAKSWRATNMDPDQAKRFRVVKLEDQS